jgi:hypothetical protein
MTDKLSDENGDVMPGEETAGRGDVKEVVYYEGTPSLRGALGSLTIAILLGAGAIAISVALRHYGWWIPLLGVVVASAIVALPIILFRSVRYRISNYRIDYERGVFSRDIDTLELWHVEDLKFHQSLLDRIMRIGAITVLSHDDTTPKLFLKALPNPRPVFETLKQRIITVKRQRGVIKLDAG